MGLGLGEQREAGSRDGGGIYRAVHDVEAGWGWQGAAGHDVPRKDGGAGRAELSRDMVAEGGAHHRQGSTLARCISKQRYGSPCRLPASN